MINHAEDIITENFSLLKVQSFDAFLFVARQDFFTDYIDEVKDKISHLWCGVIDGKIFGYIWLSYYPEIKSFTLSGFSVAMELRGKKKIFYIFEAAKLIIKYVFDNLAPELYSFSRVENKATNKILKKLNFKYLNTGDAPDGFYNCYRLGGN